MERELLVEDYDLGGNGLEAYYAEMKNFRAIAIDTDSIERRRMWELVAHGLERVPHFTRRLVGRTSPESGGFHFFAAGVHFEADVLAVRAVFAVLEEMEPDWTAAVEDARRLADKPEVIAAWSGVPTEAVLAVLGDWRTRL